MRNEKKRDLLKRRHGRIRKKVIGTKERPRMSVKFTGKHIYVQFVDDEAGVTLACASTASKSVKGDGSIGANVKGAEKIGTLAAEAAKSSSIETVVFDRGGAKYHGKVKALADAAREGGLKF